MYRTYSTNEQRAKIIADAELSGYELTHDTFTATGGKLSFELPPTPTAEELADEAERKALAQVDTIIDGITTIAGMKVFMKRLCARLVRNGVLP